MHGKAEDGEEMEINVQEPMLLDELKDREEEEAFAGVDNNYRLMFAFNHQSTDASL